MTTDPPTEDWRWESFARHLSSSAFKTTEASILAAPVQRFEVEWGENLQLLLDSVPYPEGHPNRLTTLLGTVEDIHERATLTGLHGGHGVFEGLSPQRLALR